MKRDQTGRLRGRTCPGGARDRHQVPPRPLRAHTWPGTARRCPLKVWSSRAQEKGHVSMKGAWPGGTEGPTCPGRQPAPPQRRKRLSCSCEASVPSSQKRGRERQGHRSCSQDRAGRGSVKDTGTRRYAQGSPPGGQATCGPQAREAHLCHRERRRLCFLQGRGCMALHEPPVPAALAPGHPTTLTEHKVKSLWAASREPGRCGQGAVSERRQLEVSLSGHQDDILPQEQGPETEQR